MNRRKLEKISGVFDRSTVALTLADMSAPDQPLILANPIFLSMAGYSEAEVLGRNCRFLQTADGNDTARAEVRRALAMAQETQIVLRNVRRDGSLFDNLLFLHPVGGKAGKAAYYLGSQFVLRAEMQMEAAMNAHTAALSDELTQMGAVTTQLKMDRRRNLADAAAALIRAWVRNG